MQFALRNKKLPVKLLAVSIGLAVAEAILIGLPGPCGIPGVFDSLFSGHRALEAVLAFGTAIIVLLGMATGALWLISAFVVGLLDAKNPTI
jgi:hypothetical protein